MFNEERTFGVEIEFIGNAQKVERAMRNEGLACYSESYNHTTKSHWKIVTDSSVHATGNQMGNGLELVSPILKGQNGMNQLEKACKALEAAGAKVNKTCGLHVHHDARDFTSATFVNLLLIYGRFEEAIDSLVSPSRRGNQNTYCGSIQMLNYSHEEIKEMAQLTPRQICNRIGTRYIKLNFQSYITHGTVEFRQHQGTIEFEKMYNWILLTQAMVERGTAREVKQGRNNSWNRFRTFLFITKEGTGYSNAKSAEAKSMVKYFEKRRKELAA